ncbi:hypothetical protein MMC24_001471 [Lignoscripta atroalba]|nr:hypothetical protein [Lignoscripta atroalba]
MILWPISISRGLADFVFLFTAVVTDEFLDFSASRGNDLRQIPGMKGGCKWCLCTNRWKEAVDARKSDDDPVVPKVFLHATDESALGNGITMDTLKKFAAESEVDAGGSGGGPTPRTAIPLTPGVSPGVKETH